MLRHSTSLFVSVMMHVVLLAGVVVLYQMYRSPASEPKEHRLCLCLNQVAEAVPLSESLPPPSLKERVPEVIPPPKPVSKTPPPQPKPLPKVSKEIPKKPVVVPPKAVKKDLEQPKQKVKPKAKPKEPEVQNVTAVPEYVAPKALESTLRQADIPVMQRTASPRVEAVAPVVQKSTQERYLEEHLQIISQLLRRHLYYPKRARKRHMQGNVIVVFELLQNGDIGAIHVKQSSNRGILDRAAVKTISKLSGKVPKPAETITIEIPIQFRLRS